jgi:hypothetical protein
MRLPRSMRGLETLGRVRFSEHFYMREFLYWEIANFHGLHNIPDDSDLAIENGRGFCTDLRDPLEDAFWRVAVRFGDRSAAVKRFGTENGLNCARNDNSLECHNWDRNGGAKVVPGASIVIPWFADPCMRTAASGATSRGGFTIISPIRRCGSSRSSAPSISRGDRTACERSRAASRRKARC